MLLEMKIILNLTLKMFKFGKISKQRLSTCHPDIQLIMDTFISLSLIDFGIAEGYRSIEDQIKYFKQGKSKIDGYKRRSKHNYKPSLAVDIYPFFNGKAQWDNEHLSYLAGGIHAVSEMLLKENKTTHRIRWGGNWDMDGKILIDQSFDDRPHFELIKK